MSAGIGSAGSDRDRTGVGARGPRRPRSPCRLPDPLPGPLVGRGQAGQGQAREGIAVRSGRGHVLRVPRSQPLDAKLGPTTARPAPPRSYPYSRGAVATLQFPWSPPLSPPPLCHNAVPRDVCVQQGRICFLGARGDVSPILSNSRYVFLLAGQM